METEKIMLDGKEIDIVVKVDSEYKSMDYYDEDINTSDLSNLKEELENTMEIINE